MVARVIVLTLFLALGILFSFGKGSFLIAGYNTMSKEEKAGYDEKKLLKTMSHMMFSFAVCTAVGLIGESLKVKWLGTLGFVLIVPCLVFFLIRVNKNTLN